MTRWSGSRAGVANRAGRFLAVAAVTALCMLPAVATAQSALERPPNLGGGWIGHPGQAYFHFTHRFSLVGSVHKVVNSPSFLLAAGLPGNILAGAVYATSSDISPLPRPNEWEFFTRWQPVQGGGALPLRLTLQGGYNVAAASFDGEAATASELGPVRWFGAARILSRPFGGADPRVALGTGAVWRIGRWGAVGADVASLMRRAAAERIAWSAGLLLGIPYTPHTLSLHATNANTSTLQGASRGGEEVRWGFEFTVPLTLSRFTGGTPAPAVIAVAPTGPGGEAGEAGEAGTAGAAGVVTAVGVAGADTVRASMTGLEYGPARLEVAAGTTITWTNRAPVPHTVTGDDGSWGSPLLDPGEVWSYTFAKPGTYPFHCAPHPFMKGVVVVR